MQVHLLLKVFFNWFLQKSFSQECPYWQESPSLWITGINRSVESVVQVSNIACSIWSQILHDLHTAYDAVF